MTDWITSIVERFSYGGVVFLMFLENVFPPIPSELIMPLAGFVSADGRLSFWGVIIAGTAGSVLGALPLYGLGHSAGEKRLRSWLERRGHWVGVSSDDLTKAIDWFDRRGGLTVLFCRLIPGVRSLISIPAGLAHMNFVVFLAYTTVGSAAWTAALAWAGHRLGQNYEKVEKVIGPVSTAVVALIVITFVIRALRQSRARRRHAT